MLLPLVDHSDFSPQRPNKISQNSRDFGSSQNHFLSSEMPLLVSALPSPPGECAQSFRDPWVYGQSLQLPLATGPMGITVSHVTMAGCLVPAVRGSVWLLVSCSPVWGISGMTACGSANCRLTVQCQIQLGGTQSTTPLYKSSLQCRLLPSTH